VGALDELRPASADEIRSLREDLRALETRIAALEGAATNAPAAAAKRGASTRKAPAARKAPAKKSTAAKKPAAAK
jgi:hypothetical protein